MIEMFKELILLKEKTYRTLQFGNFLIAANNQEIGTRFHLLTAKTHADTFMNLLSYLVCIFGLEL